MWKKLSLNVPRTSLTSASVASHSAEIELIELTRCARKALATCGSRMLTSCMNEQGQLVSELSEQSQSVMKSSNKSLCSYELHSKCAVQSEF
jgi:hypothetical protein